MNLKAYLFPQILNSLQQKLPKITKLSSSKALVKEFLNIYV